ncbi:MAG: MFS transporter [Rubrivivax sp.]
MPAPSAPAAPPRGVRRLDPALVVMLAGVCAALHVGKLPPALHTLQQAFGLTLVQAGFLLSLVQLAGMTAGVAFGVLADGIGLRRSMLAGLVLLALASAAGGAADGVPMLMLLRACEGCGFLLAALPAPALVRRLVPAERISLVLGLWGAYMPLATALVLLLGPLAIAAFGWRAWWYGLGALTGAMALWLARAVPADRPRPHPLAPAGMAARAAPAWTARLARTLVAPGPWLVALTFAAYSAQWLAIIGFLPVIYTEAGFGAAATGALTAAVAAVNMIGNIGAGQLLHRGWPAPRLLAIGFVTMALAGAATFAATASGPLLPHSARYAAVLLLSAVGGLIPATLFALAVRLAPGEAMISSTVGWMQQWSSFGQFVGPPLVAAVASAAGGWQRTWLVTGACCLGGLALSAALAARLRQPTPARSGHG